VCCKYPLNHLTQKQFVVKFTLPDRGLTTKCFPVSSVKYFVATSIFVGEEHLMNTEPKFLDGILFEGKIALKLTLTKDTNKRQKLR
jgi:hypothetical protein